MRDYEFFHPTDRRMIRLENQVRYAEATDAEIEAIEARMAADVDGSWARYCADRKRGAKARVIPGIGCVSLTDEEFAFVLGAAEALSRPAGDPAPAAPTISACGRPVTPVVNQAPACEPVNLSDRLAAEADRDRDLGHEAAGLVVEALERIATEARLADAATTATLLDDRGALKTHGSADTA